MGEKLLTATVASLVIIWAIDWFDGWYERFLERRGLSPQLRKNFRMIQWVVLALLFWFSLVNAGLPPKFGSAFFLYVLFIYSLRGLLVTASSRPGSDRESRR
ncbi:MAG: hypothetical protein GXO73_07700 [Calditrichaeota bacterium]|nr:hypothetical protein [Calditrichota bacterium]